MRFPFIELTGMTFKPNANGTKATMGASSIAAEVDTRDMSVNDTFVANLNAQIGSDGRMTYGSSYMLFPSSFATTGFASRPAGFWGKSTAAAGPNTFVLFFSLPLWANYLPFYSNASVAPSAQLSAALSARSMDRYLQTIPVTQNGVLALVEGRTGMMLGSSTPNISESWPTQYPAIGNSNGLVSAAATELARRFSSLDPAVNGTVSLTAITNRAQSNFQFGYGGDTIYCSTTWVTNDTIDLSLLLMLM
ncbi:hypothetical protein HK405_013188, partial [Cladochytrium tenue]